MNKVMNDDKENVPVMFPMEVTFYFWAYNSVVANSRIISVGKIFTLPINLTLNTKILAEV